MSVLCLRPQDAMRLIELARSPIPPHIAAFKNEMEGEIKAAELAASITGVIDEARIIKLAQMKLHLDTLYAEWTMQQLSLKRENLEEISEPSER
ncbi:MAG: hypothetical protein WC641_05305 [Patescibacteria group bacterium]